MGGSVRLGSGEIGIDFTVCRVLQPQHKKPFIHPSAKGDFFIFCILHTFDGVVQSVSQQRGQIDIGH